MELQELERAFREQSDDVGGFQLYTSEWVARAATEAEREAAVRGRLLFDDTTAELTTFAMLADQAVITLDPRVWVIDSATYLSSGGSRPRDVEIKGVDWLRNQCDWATRSCSRPGYIVHFARYQARIWPMPTLDGLLQLSVYRLPLYDLEDPDDEPEIGVELHNDLIDWILYRAYGQKDSELRDDARAADHLASFTEKFGEKDSAEVQRRHRERRCVTTRYGGL